MPRLGPVDVWVETADGNKHFEEHKVSIEGTQRAECFIESKTGEGFSIVVRLDSNMKYVGHDGWRIRFKVDGQPVASRVMGPAWRKSCIIAGVDSGPVTLKPFQFGATQFTEEGRTEKHLLNNLGSIIVEMHRVNIGEKVESKVGGYEVLSEKKVHETAKKALITHTVQFGEEIIKRPDTFWNVHEVDPKNVVTHMFVFNYRSRAILEAQDILPRPNVLEEESRSDSPEDSSVSEDDEDEDENLDPAAIRRLKEELRNLRKQVKRELTIPPKEADIVDLTGRPTKKRKTVVDLTF